MADTKTLLLVDLSSIAHPIWHTVGADTNVNAASERIVARVLALSTGYLHAAICCDAGKSFRNELSADYKANRPERDAALMHQIDLSIEALKQEGFPVWKMTGYEADDVIASATARALEAGWSVLICTGDKDMLQLVSADVKAKSVKDGSILDAAAVFAKLGVHPHQVRDYLTLLGDASDNVKGAKNIGEKTAAKLLAEYKTVDAIYNAIADGSAKLTTAVSKSLIDFHPDLKLTRELITLKADAPVPFDEVLTERISKAVEAFDDEPTGAAAPIADAPVTDAAGETRMAVLSSEPAPPPAEWERQLDPRSMPEAKAMARMMFESRMFSAYGTPQAVLSTVMVGRELGLPAMASLRSIHNVDGKHSLSSALMVALVLKSGMAEYFEPVEFGPTSATFVTKRKGARKEQSFTFTIEDARKAWKKSQDAWDKSGWGSYPTNMLIARAQAMLARLIYPDLLAGLYTPEELQDMREAA